MIFCFILLSVVNPSYPDRPSRWLSILLRQSIAGDLILCLLVAMHNQLVQEAAGFSLMVSICFRLVDLGLEVTRRLLVDVFGLGVVVELGCRTSQWGGWKRGETRQGCAHGSCRAETTSS